MKTAAQYYPANYWYALLEVPGENEFPGTSASGNGISPNIKSQAQWIHLIKTDSCESCHQLGNQYTRTIPAMFSDLDPAQAWMRRLQSGQAGAAMMGGLAQLGAQASHRSSLAIGPPGSRRASCPRRRLRGRRASSATW